MRTRAKIQTISKIFFFAAFCVFTEPANSQNAAKQNVLKIPNDRTAICILAALKRHADKLTKRDIGQPILLSCAGLLAGSTGNSESDFVVRRPPIKLQISPNQANCLYKKVPSPIAGDGATIVLSDCGVSR